MPQQAGLQGSTAEGGTVQQRLGSVAAVHGLWGSVGESHTSWAEQRGNNRAGLVVRCQLMGSRAGVGERKGGRRLCR